MGRELESVRSEAAQQQRSAAAQLDRLLAQTAQLEETAAELRRQNRQLGQERDEAGRLAEVRSEGRVRHRCPAALGGEIPTGKCYFSTIGHKGRLYLNT